MIWWIIGGILVFLFLGVMFMKGAGCDPVSPDEGTQASCTEGAQRTGYDLVPAGFVDDATELLNEFIELATPSLDGMGHTIEEGMRLRAVVVSAKLFLGEDS